MLGLLSIGPAATVLPLVKYPSGSKMLVMTFSVSRFVEHSVCFDPMIISRSLLVFQRITSTLARISFILSCSDSIKAGEFEPHSRRFIEAT